MESSKNKKIIAISVMRVIAMLMIIFFHSLCFYTNRWWIFGGVKVPMWDKAATYLNCIDLPMFMYISGFLFGYLFLYEGKYKDRKIFLISKFKRLLLPYLIWGTFQLIFMPSIFEWKSIFTGSGHLWFLLVLFEMFTIVIPFSFQLCRKINKITFELVILISLVIYVLFDMHSNHHSFMAIHSLLYYFPFFLIGIYTSRFNILQKISKKRALVTLLIGLSLLLFFINSFISFSILNVLCSFLLGWIIVLSFHAYLDSINILDSSKCFSIVSHFDKLSMGIYIFHHIIIDAFLLSKSVRCYLNDHIYSGPLFIFTIGLFGAWGLSVIFSKSSIKKLIGC